MQKPSREAGPFESLPSLRAATLLIFLAGAARARIVSSDLVSAHDLLHGVGFTQAACHLRLLEFALLLALELSFHVVERSAHRAPTPWRLVAVAAPNCLMQCAAPVAVRGN